MDDASMKKVLNRVAKGLMLDDKPDKIGPEEYQALVDGYQLGYFSNMILSRVDSNKVKVAAINTSQPITLSDLGREVLWNLSNTTKPIGFRKE